jgi:hypothetical protein
VSVLEDRVNARLASNQALLGETQGAVGEANRILADELARLRAGEPDAVVRGRTALAAAESQRAAAESQLVAAIDAELRARAGTLVALLRRDTEAAEFGAASAAFFKAADAGGTRTPAGTTTTPGGTAGESRDTPAAPAAPAGPPNSPR